MAKVLKKFKKKKIYKKIECFTLELDFDFHYQSSSMSFFCVIGIWIEHIIYTEYTTTTKKSIQFQIYRLSRKYLFIFCYIILYCMYSCKYFIISISLNF